MRSRKARGPSLTSTCRGSSGRISTSRQFLISSISVRVSIQAVFLDPGLRDGAEAEQPVVEFLQAPAAANDEALAQALVLEATEPVAHRDTRLRGVPVHVAFRAGFREAEMLLHVLDRLLVAVAP